MRYECTWMIGKRIMLKWQMSSTDCHMKYENNEWYDDILRQYNMNKWQTEHMWIEYNVRAWQSDCHYELVILKCGLLTFCWNGLGQ